MWFSSLICWFVSVHVLLRSCCPVVQMCSFTCFMPRFRFKGLNRHTLQYIRILLKFFWCVYHFHVDYLLNCLVLIKTQFAFSYLIIYKLSKKKDSSFEFSFFISFLIFVVYGRDNFISLFNKF